MMYEEFLSTSSLNKLELIAHANGTLVEGAPPDMGLPPAPPMLMLDRVISIRRSATEGRIVGEQDIALDAWYFWCHFRRDPVQPGCLGVDAIWQLIGLYLTMTGAPGAGRALGCGEVEFFGQIRPHNKLVRYEVDIRRSASMPSKGAAIAIGDAVVSVDGDAVYRIRNARVGAFEGIRYADYPHKSANGVGGPTR
jgi:3-hydroxyacyl-[acyl-carrier protein] dehydratase/trans-2-decenoyl-[acyl-carrier protein] isomerase